MTKTHAVLKQGVFSFSYKLTMKQALSSLRQVSGLHLPGGGEGGGGDSYIYIYGDPLILDKNVQTATARSPSSANVHLHMTKTESQQTKYLKEKSLDLYSEINVQHLLKN